MIVDQACRFAFVSNMLKMFFTSAAFEIMKVLYHTVFATTSSLEKRIKFGAILGVKSGD